MFFRRFSWLLAGAAGLVALNPGCTGGDDFTASSTGGTKDSGGSGGHAGDASPDSKSGTDAKSDTSSGGNANGTACSSSGECQSGQCVDGFCCDAECKGLCTSCKLPGKEGTCSPYSAGIDPESDCKKVDAGESCEQVCDGSGACVSCGEFKCGTTGCLTTCTSDDDCKTTGWCSSGTCVAKKDNGKACGGANQCQSGHCEAGSCCKTACGSPLTCETGECLCAGVACSSGNSCAIWYLDQDGDGFPASSSNDKVSCTQPPDLNGKKYMPGPPTDCYDGNEKAFPGATEYYPVHRGDGSFDYNCDGQEQLKFPNVGGVACKACGQVDSTGTCKTCTVGVISWPINPGYLCTPPCGGGYNSAFKAQVPCGATGALYTCNAQQNCTMTETSVSNVSQQCR